MLVDSDVLIAHLRGRESARDWLLDARREHGRLSISVVTLTELKGGMRSNERQTVRAFLATFTTLDVTADIADHAGDMMRRYRRSHSGIGLGDYLIAATAVAHGLAVATLNVRHFPMFPDLQSPFAHQ